MIKGSDTLTNTPIFAAKKNLPSITEERLLLANDRYAHKKSEMSNIGQDQDTGVSVVCTHQSDPVT